MDWHAIDVAMRQLVFEPLEMRDSGVLIRPATHAAVVCISATNDGSLSKFLRGDAGAGVLNGRWRVVNDGQDYLRFCSCCCKRNLEGVQLLASRNSRRHVRTRSANSKRGCCERQVAVPTTTIRSRG